MTPSDRRLLHLLARLAAITPGHAPLAEVEAIRGQIREALGDDAVAAPPWCRHSDPTHPIFGCYRLAPGWTMLRSDCDGCQHAAQDAPQAAGAPSGHQGSGAAPEPLYGPLVAEPWEAVMRRLAEVGELAPRSPDPRIETAAKALAWAELTPEGRRCCSWERDFAECERQAYRATALIVMEAINAR